MTSLLLCQHGSTLAKGNVPAWTLFASFLERSTRYVKIGGFGKEFDGNLALVPDLNTEIMWCSSAHDKGLRHENIS